MAKATQGLVAKPRSPKALVEATAAERIREVLAHVEKQITKSEFKVTLGDYIRLLQLQKEYDKEKPRDIEVTWIESLNENELNAA